MARRIERHTVGDKALEEAAEGFFDEVSRDVRYQQESGRSGSGWRMIADDLLDYAGACSVAVPRTDADIRVALYSAAEARVGGLKLDGAPSSAEFSVHLTYTGTGVFYQYFDEEREEEPRGQTRVFLPDWAEALYLCVIADLHDSNEGTFIQFAAAFAENEVLHRALTYYLFPRLGAEREQVLRYAEAAMEPFFASLGRELGERHPDYDSVSSDLLFLHALLSRNEEGFWELMAFRLEWLRERLQGGGSPKSLLPVPELAFAAMAVRIEGWQMPFESDYLPRRLVEGERRYSSARVGPYGADKDPEALRKRENGRLTVERPTGSFATERGVENLFRYQDRDLQQVQELADRPDRLVHELQHHAAREFSGFRVYSVVDPQARHPRQIAALNHASQYTAAVFASVTGKRGETVEATIGETAVTLPCAETTQEISEYARRSAIEYALLSGSLERLDTLVGHPLNAFLADGEGRCNEVNTLYSIALLSVLKAERARGWRRWTGNETRPGNGAVRAAMDDAVAALADYRVPDYPPPPVVLLSQLVAGDREGFDLALTDALEVHRDVCGIGNRVDDSDSLINPHVLALVCLARAQGWEVRLDSDYLPQGVLDRAAAMFG
ncbi:immunity 49 family protein [Nocardiopsis valliformis]|uniref:immunity 49 family protein n=1 Tax=Nocardiopsis valliformis TaxID=239974 RepID=UPI00034B0ECF|nr:immunity 49 family protein [Nocardiopsis valliformis]